MTWAGVIGSPIQHSLSPVLHLAAWRDLGLPEDWEYRRIEVRPQDLRHFCAHLDSQCVGLSVTMPHKNAVCEFLDVIDPLAEVVGAVNTVVPTAGILTGFNTDVYGIIQSLTNADNNIASTSSLVDSSRRAVIFGSGASAASALNALWTMGIKDISIAARRFNGPHSVSRAAHRMGVDFEQLSLADTQTIRERIRHATYVVSTLPSGIADSIVLPESLKPTQTLLDIVYSPWHTVLSGAWQSAGGHVVHGTQMLLHQAAFQVKLMTGREANVDIMRRALLEEVEGK